MFIIFHFFLPHLLRLFTCGTSNRLLLLNFSSFLHQTEFNRLLNKIKLISPHKYPRKFHNKKLDSKEEVKERNWSSLIVWLHFFFVGFISIFSCFGGIGWGRGISNNEIYWLLKKILLPCLPPFILAEFSEVCTTWLSLKRTKQKASICGRARMIVSHAMIRTESIGSEEQMEWMDREDVDEKRTKLLIYDYYTK